MIEKDKLEINIIYDIRDKNEENINIFGYNFVKNNKSICKMIINDKEYEITQKYNIKNYNDNKLIIKLKGIAQVTSMEDMFSGCSSLLSLPDISNWNTYNITNMSYLFNGCRSLLSLPDISKWNTSNVTNMRGMFNICQSLSSIPDISKWDTHNFINISGIFRCCSSLSSIPDISKWNTNNVTDMSWIFYGCRPYHLYPIFQNGILIMLQR